MATVILFDIDGTLIGTGGAGRRAIDRAVVRALGEADAAPLPRAGFSFAGMTDRAIVRRLLEERGRAAHEAAIDAVLVAYLDVLREEVEHAADYRVHEGMREALEALSARPDCAIGLGTGNVAAGARIKLERVDLNRYFRFGGFGCDHEERAALLRIGALRGAERLGLPLEHCRILVVGDTPRDVAAAHAIGARCFAVATGGGSREELEASGADHVFTSLSAPRALDTLLSV